MSAAVSALTSVPSLSTNTILSRLFIIAVSTNLANMSRSNSACAFALLKNSAIISWYALESVAVLACSAIVSRSANSSFSLPIASCRCQRFP